MMISVLAFAALLQTPSPPSQAVAAPTTVAAPAAPRLYAVIFAIDTDDKGKVAKLAVAQVLDPMSGSKTPVDLPVPEQFVAASKEQLLLRDYAPNQHLFTYTFFDPQRPGKADIDPRASRP